MDEYLNIVHQSGFSDLTIHKEKRIELPDNILSGTDSESGSGVYSITISANKSKKSKSL